MKAFSFTLNSSADCVFVNSRCTALDVAHVNIRMQHLPSSFLVSLYVRGEPAKSTPVVLNGRPLSIQNVGSSAVAV